MRVADFIVSRLNFLGLDTAFVVTGGGAMYLNDALRKNQNIKKIYCHHEQGAAMAAEGYGRVSKKPAIVNVTAGPGGINALNGVFGAYTDSIPMIVVSGQVKRETLLATNPVEGLRQLGDQEVDILDMVKKITKWQAMVEYPEDVVEIVEKAFVEATSGRPGPVWIDVPVDVQGNLLADNLEEKISDELEVVEQEDVYSKQDLLDVLQKISSARRPVIFAGSGVGLSNTESSLLAFAEQMNVPVVTAWTHDIFPNDHSLFAGRPGTIGTRAGNFVVQNADLVLILGSRLNIRQISYNWGSFAKNAYKIWVDIDSSELAKPFLQIEKKIVADLRSFLPSLVNEAKVAKTTEKQFSKWVAWCQEIGKKYTPKPEDYPASKDRINSYHFIHELFKHLDKDDVVVCGNATATIVPYQIGAIKQGMRLISNSGSASMGYDVPASLGAAAAKDCERVICLAGDGSIMMNLQELQTISALELNVIVFVLNNDGYLSIKQTQKNFFGHEGGASSFSGLAFPDFAKVAEGFHMKSISLHVDCWKAELSDLLKENGPVLCEVPLDLIQEFEPRLKSKMVNGKIETPELDDMFPFLSLEELHAVRQSAIEI